MYSCITNNLKHILHDQLIYRQFLPKCLFKLSMNSQSLKEILRKPCSGEEYFRLVNIPTRGSHLYSSGEGVSLLQLQPVELVSQCRAFPWLQWRWQEEPQLGPETRVSQLSWRGLWQCPVGTMKVIPKKTDSIMDGHVVGCSMLHKYDVYKYVCIHIYIYIVLCISYIYTP